MTQAAGMMKVDVCPVCGSDGRHEAYSGIASVRRDTGRHYLQFAIDKLGVTLDQLLEAIRVYQCDECGSYYCDPWITPEIASDIFTDGAPDHMAGWGNFEQWLSSAKLNSVELANRQLFRLLEEKIGRISSYAEYGCPYQGFLLLFRKFETTPWQRVKLFGAAIHRNPDVRWTKGPRLHNTAQRFANLLPETYHKFRVLKEHLQGGDRASSFPLNAAFPCRRVLLTDEATKHWGNNCVRYGFSCKYFANRMLCAHVLPLHEMACHTAGYAPTEFDLLGIFNILDHTHSPIEVLNRCIFLARHVIIVTHHATLAGKQHLYAFDESFPAWLTSSLKNVTIEDISELMLENGKRAYNYILISRAESALK